MQQKQYGGFKLVHATQMTAGEAGQKGYRTGDVKTSDCRGYEVEYEDGYKSWSPADVFEQAYVMVGGIVVNPEYRKIMKFFEFTHLPAHLQSVSAPFTVMANRIIALSRDADEGAVALRKLLESKDAAVRACL